MKPYYQDEAVTLYCGESRDLLPGLIADVAITDPPYNVGKDYGPGTDDRRDDYEDWLAEVLSLSADAAPNGVIWFPGTANVWNVPSVAARAGLRLHRLLGWHKREFAGDKWMGGPAMCWEPIVWSSRVEKPPFNKTFGTWGRDFLTVNATHGDPFYKEHPCPKPFPVMKWLVSLFVPEGGTVLDPFAGTGTTLRAAKDLGRKAIGIEINGAYCELAVRRLAQEVLDFEVPA